MKHRSASDPHGIAVGGAHTGLPTVQEAREHFSVMASVKGRSWYAKKLLEFQRFPDRQVASRTLIQLSRTRIEETRVRIVRTKNIRLSRGDGVSGSIDCHASHRRAYGLRSLVRPSYAKRRGETLG